MIVGADALSKAIDRMDFSLSPEVFGHLLEKFGPFDVDRFAAPHNAKCARFNAKFDTPGAEAVDAFTQDWREGVSYVLGDFNHSDQIMDVIERDNAAAVVIFPEWPSHGFWRRVCSGAWQRRVVFSEFLSGDALEPNAENMSRCFFKGRFKCRLLVMRVAPVEGGEAAEGEGEAAARSTGHRKRGARAGGNSRSFSRRKQESGSFAFEAHHFRLSTSDRMSSSKIPAPPRGTAALRRARSGRQHSAFGPAGAGRGGVGRRRP